MHVIIQTSMDILISFTCYNICLKEKIWNKWQKDMICAYSRKSHNSCKICWIKIVMQYNQLQHSYKIRTKSIEHFLKSWVYRVKSDIHKNYHWYFYVSFLHQKKGQLNCNLHLLHMFDNKYRDEAWIGQLYTRTGIILL